jgi:hypothetical protein
VQVVWGLVPCQTIEVTVEFEPPVGDPVRHPADGRPEVVAGSCLVSGDVIETEDHVHATAVALRHLERDQRGAMIADTGHDAAVTAQLDEMGSLSVTAGAEVRRDHRR